MRKKDGVIAYYPVSLSIRGRQCVVVGGGEVALRKVKALLEHGANVVVISPALCPELAQLAGNRKINVRPHAYEAGDLAGAFLAIAATDDAEINRRVAAEARSKAVLINVVDDAENSDFIAPSYLRRDGLTIAVSTSGQSPALARKIRTRIEKEIVDQYGTLTHLVGEVRSEIEREGTKVGKDRWQEALDIDLLIELLKKWGKGKAKAVLLSKLKGK
ncbi:bifunctional precorrin-2 dehydrogenase/sirohydrochlorin ferrochelatase [Chloroflexota bacterium]